MHKIIIIIDLLLLELTVTDLEKRVEKTEHKLKSALGRITILEEQDHNTVPPFMKLLSQKFKDYFQK